MEHACLLGNNIKMQNGLILSLKFYFDYKKWTRINYLHIQKYTFWKSDLVVF